MGNTGSGGKASKRKRSDEDEIYDTHVTSETKDFESPCVPSELKSKEIDLVKQQSNTTSSLEDMVNLQVWDQAYDSCRYLTYLIEMFIAGQYNVFPEKQCREIKYGFEMSITPMLKIKVFSKIQIGMGDYSDVFKAQGPQGPFENLVVKRISIVNDKTDLIEVLMHLVLYCAQQSYSQDLKIMATDHKIPVPFIPQIISYSKSDTDSYIVMQRLDTTFSTFILYQLLTPATAPQNIISCLKQVCILLKCLQERFAFMHRDLHTCNVMILTEQHDGSDHYRVGLIDFGMSRLILSHTDIVLQSSGVVDKDVEIGFPSSKVDDQLRQRTFVRTERIVSQFQ
jgi:hypothetical protein